MNYLEIIKTAILFFPFVAFIFTIPFMLYNYHKYGSILFIKSLIIYSFIFYLICAYFLVILPLPSIEKVASLTTPRVQLIPFKFIYDIVINFNFSILKNASFYVPLYNIFLTLPFAIYLRYYFNTSKKQTIIYTFLLSLFFELTQLTGIYFIYPRGYRLFDVDDLLLNTFGGFLGYLLSFPILKHVPSRKKVNERSIKKGKEVVSGLRKTTSFCIDLFLIMIFWYILTLFFDNYKLLFVIVCTCYVFLIPTFFKGRTFGEIFLKMVVVTDKDKVNILQTYLRRLVFLIMYLVIPYIICYFYIYKTEGLTTKTKIIIAFIFFIVFLLYYAISIIKFIFFNKKMLYEKISKTKYKSTIKE